MPTGIEIEGISEIVKVLDKLPGNIRRNAIIGAGKRALKPTQAAARTFLISQADSFKNERGFSKLKYVAKNIRIVASKNKRSPGVNLYVKGNDLPVGNRFWKLYGYSRLLAFGSKDRTTRGGARRGVFHEFGNFLKNGYLRTRGHVTGIFRNEIRRELEKAVQRAVARYGKRY